jgi:DNA-binding transcriptional LysR family regulator
LASGPDGKPANVRVSGNLVTSSPELLMVSLLEGGGVLLAPSFVIRDDIETRTLVPLMPEYRPVEFAFNAIYPHRRHLATKVRSFIDLAARAHS